MKLTSALITYLNQNTRVTTEKTRQQYACCLRQFTEATGGSKLKHVTDANLGLFLNWMRDRDYAVHTQAQKLHYLLAFAKYYAKRNECPWPTIKSPVLPDLAPTALTLDQLSLLMHAAANVTGAVCGAPAGLWWSSIVDWFWLTGERTQATLTGVRLENLTESTILVPAQYRKGRRKPMTYELPGDLIEGMRELDNIHGRESVWHWELHKSDFYARWRMLYESAGLTYVPYKTGPHQLRRSHASWIEANGGNATESLGHSSRAVTLRSYIDRRIAKRPNFGQMLPSLDVSRN